jgi:hypothetical protein
MGEVGQFRADPAEWIAAKFAGLIGYHFAKLRKIIQGGKE